MGNGDVELKPAAVRDLKAIPERDRKRIKTRIDALAENPRPHGVKALQGGDATSLTYLRRTGIIAAGPGNSTWEVLMVHGARVGRTVAALFALLWVASTLAAAPIPSKVTDSAALVSSHADRKAIEASHARQEVADALAAHGLSAEEVEQRVAQLSAEDLSVLAANLDQIQAAGAVPKYIWILLAILIGVTIIVTVF